MQQAQQDDIVFSGFLNHFKWNETHKSAFIFLSVSDQDQQQQTVYRSIPITVTSKLANMLSAKYDEITAARAQGQKHPVLIQIYKAKVSSYSPLVNGVEAFPSIQITGFRGRQISANQERLVMDDSENPQWATGQAPQQQYSAPQQQAAPQQQYNAPQQQAAPQQQYAPQAAPQQQYAPQAAPQQQYNAPQSNQLPDDDDIPF